MEGDGINDAAQKPKYVPCNLSSNCEDFSRSCTSQSFSCFRSGSSEAVNSSKISYEWFHLLFFRSFQGFRKRMVQKHMRAHMYWFRFQSDCFILFQRFVAVLGPLILGSDSQIKFLPVCSRYFSTIRSHRRNNCYFSQAP